MSELSFLKLLKTIISDVDIPEYPANWNQVPKKTQEEFIVWVGEYKQQDWTNNRMRGWEIYHLEFIDYLISKRIASFNILNKIKKR